MKNTISDFITPTDDFNTFLIQNLKFYYTLQKLSSGVYLKKFYKTKRNRNNYEFEDFKKNNNIRTINITDGKWGFHAETFVYQNKIVIAFRGTNDLKDVLLSDVPMAFGISSKQYDEAKKYYDFINGLGDNSMEIVLTGHSLGGSLAQYVAYKKMLKAITFSAFGIKDTLKKKNYKLLNIAEKNIINFGSNRDIIFMKNITKHIGQAFVIKDKNKFYKDGIKNRHSNINIGDLKDAKPYNSKEHRLIGSLERSDDSMA